jgi:hypothetical protein
LFSPKRTTGNAITPILSLAFEFDIISLALFVIIEFTSGASTTDSGHTLFLLSLVVLKQSYYLLR